MTVTALGQGGGVTDDELKKLATQVAELLSAEKSERPPKRWRSEHTTYSGLAGVLITCLTVGYKIADKVDTHKAELSVELHAQTKELEDLRLEVATTHQLVSQIDEARRQDRAEILQVRQDLQRTREDVSALRARIEQEGRK